MSETIVFSSFNAQLFKKDLAKYCSFSGINKFYNLLCAIDIGIAHIGWVELIKYIEKDLEEMKSFEEKTGNKTIYSHVKNWNQLYHELQKIRPVLAEIQFRYDEIYKKKDVEAREVQKVNTLRKIAQRISPYNMEMHYLLNVILKMSNMAYQSIPNEYLKSAETIEYSKDPFAKPRTETLSQNISSEGLQ